MESIEKKYYKISEVAELTGMAPSALRYWETQFNIIKPKRNAKGSRFYTPDDVEKNPHGAVSCQRARPEN